MKALDRRHFAASLVATAATAWAPVARADFAPVSIPLRAMRLSRLVERSLHDGNRIIVERDWIVRFDASGRGVRVDGFQADVRVEAPARLAPLAEIERGRDTNGRFPILLGADGRIIGAAVDEDGAAVEQAVRAAEQIIRRSGQTVVQQGAAIRNLAAIQAAGSSVLETMPADLFFPVCGQTQDTRKLALPDGSTGEFEVQHAAARAEEGPWLAQLERRIVTRLAQTERYSREVWSMAAA